MISNRSSTPPSSSLDSSSHIILANNQKSLNPNDYNPISTIEQQYSDSPLGRRTVLILQLNKACIVPGGIDTVLKKSEKERQSESERDLMEKNGFAAALNQHGTKLKSNDPSVMEDMNGLTLTTNYDSNTNANFDFLQGDVPAAPSLPTASPSSTPTQSKFKVASIFAKAKNHIERGVTNMAVQAQKVSSVGNKDVVIQDIITIGVYAQDAMTGEYNICLGMTERHKLPPNKDEDKNGSAVINDDDEEGITFQIPILLPPHLLQTTNTSSNINLKFNLWMRSGAAIFAKNRALRKYYSTGTGILKINHLLQSIQQSQPNIMQQSSVSHPPVRLDIPVQSTIITDGKIHMTVLPDMKFPSLCGNGWSMSDPRVDTAYPYPFPHCQPPKDGTIATATAATITPASPSRKSKKQLFNPPLDQNYIYPIPTNSKTNPPTKSPSSSILVTTERTTESTVVLPLAVAYTELVHKAAQNSTNHTLDLASKLQCLDGSSSIHDPMHALQLGHAQVQIEVLHFLRYSPQQNNNSNGGGGMGAAIGAAIGMGGDNHADMGGVNVMINLQRPDSIFENCIASGMVPTRRYFPNATYPQHPSLSVPFYPRIVLPSDPRLLPGESTTGKKFYVGKLRFGISDHGVGGVGADVFSPIGPAGAVGTSPKRMEAIVDIDSYVNAKEEESVVQAAVVDLMTGGAVGLLVLRIAANTMEGMVEQSTTDSSTHSSGRKSSQPCTVEGGLISLVGLDTLMEDDKACYPHCDLDSEASLRVFSKIGADASDALRTADRRKRQIATMGEFMNYIYMNNHAKGDRTNETKFMLEKHEAYKAGLFGPLLEGEEDLLPEKRREPRPFRPSSSRMEPILSSIGFNIHVQNYSIMTVTKDESSGKCVSTPSGLFKNVTCGAPSDHFQGFGSKKGQLEPSISGGLRRLEAMRHTTAQYVRDSQNRLIEAISSFYSAQSQCTNVHLPGRSARHISPHNHEISALRTACIAATQKLHMLTWDIAVRRSNCFSQALGIAITLYLTHVSDTAKLQKGAWAELWQKHGFLVTFEGLLSAAGKELGMIEDAAVGIAMLRMVSVVFVTEQTKIGGKNSSACVAVPDSPYITWVRINPSGKGTQTQYLVEICVNAQFYGKMIPAPLKNNAKIRLYPMLYEMGVDIRQWGSNTAAFVKSNSGQQEEVDDDEAGIPDNDVLLALNYEAFQKMNAYAHAVYRCSEDPAVSWEQAHVEQQTQQQIHPMLRNLHEFIKTSAGKMEHGILDEAAHAAAKLGGGAAIFCKSGKDRTAMQVTFKQSQFINRYIQTGGNGHADEAQLDFNKLFDDANIMRVYGTRLPICDKNVGQSLYAFNSLQARFMPDVLKPPARALAGFLKGGRVFSKEGMIET